MAGPRSPRELVSRARVTLTWTARQAVVSGFAVLGEALFGLSLRRRVELARRDRQRPTQAGRCFNEDERVLVAALARLIVPSEDDAPGADDIDVLGPSAVQTIESWVAQSPVRLRLYRRGLAAMDQLAAAASGGPFAALPPDQQQEFFGAIAARQERRESSYSGSPAAKIRWRLEELWGMARGWAPAVHLYPVIIEDALKAFYTSEVAWTWLGYDGPPMPAGYPNLAEPRPRMKIPAVHALRAASSVRTTAPASEADVVIVGCGAGGSVVASELAQAGLSVIVLEAGRRYVPEADYLNDRTDFGLRLGEVFAPEDPRRDTYTTAGARGFMYNRVKGVGGSTLHYEGISVRLHESDFRVRSEDGVADDWPISYAELEPYYTRVEYELGVAGPDGANPFEPWRSRPYPNPPHEFNLVGRAIKRGADTLGLHLVREPLAMPTRDWQGRPACVRAGTCNQGCQISAKSSADVTFVRKAEATGRAEVRAECMVAEIELDAAGKVRAVVYVDKAGGRHRVAARAVVVAGGAVETPRLLLLNASGRFPDGLANSSGLVGRNFMEHLSVFANGLFPDRLDAWRGTPTNGIIQDDYATRAGRNFVRGWTAIVSTNWHWPVSVARAQPGWGAQHKRKVQEIFGHLGCVASIGEQLPDARNRVGLDPVVRDNLGLPVPRLVHRLGANDVAMVGAIRASLANLLEASGATRIWANQYLPGGSSHYCGTCRMGHDPARSVVDSWGRSHDVPNLYIADSSVFVTSGAANPSLTIYALAMRTAEGIVASFRRGEL